jgi:hydroxyacylglutathione hydrolase
VHHFINFMILEVFPSGPLQTNAILLGCDKTHLAAIVDAPFGCSDELFERVNALSLKVVMILFTHSHWDHIAEAPRLKELFKAPVYIHELDAGNLENPGSDRLPLMFTIKGIKPDFFLKEGQEILLGEIKIKVIHTPGHTPGGVCFYLEREGVLVSGDTLFRGTYGNLSLPTAQPKLMPGSLKKLGSLPPETQVFPGHGEDTTIGNERWLKDAQFE